MTFSHSPCILHMGEESMRYQIPLQNLEKLQKRIQRIVNKGAPIKFEVGEDCLIPYHVDGIFDYDGKLVTFYLKAKEVHVEGTYIINGWRFVATIEHKENGNVIRSIDSKLEGKIPETYRACAPYCDHCKQPRHRKDTYLIYNESAKEFKQVGKSCLMEYTNGLSADVCAEICSCIPMCESASRMDDGFMQSIKASMGASSCVTSKEAKEVSYAYVKQNGYKRGDTARAISNLVFGRGTKVRATKEQIEEVDAWVESLDASNDYLKNAKVAWESKYSEYRDIALIASLINAYFKEISRLQESSKANNTYIGEVGDKVVFKVASKRVLYCKGKYAYYGDTVYMLELHDEQGHAILWSTSSIVGVGDVIQAKIKKLGEYKGIKQTTITRGTILYHDATDGHGPYGTNEKEAKAKQDAQEALDKPIQPSEK